MLKLTLTSKRNRPAAQRVVIVRQNPEILDAGVVDNHSTWEQSGRNGNVSGQVRLMDRNQLKAMCASGTASHPMMASSTFQRRKPANSVQEGPVVEESLIGFTLQALGR